MPIQMNIVIWANFIFLFGVILVNLFLAHAEDNLSAVFGWFVASCSQLALLIAAFYCL